MNHLGSSEKKKKLKKNSLNEMQLGESFLDTLDGSTKKKKKKKAVGNELSFSDRFAFEMSGKKKSNQDVANSSLTTNGTPKPDESAKKKKKKSISSLGPTEQESMASPALEKKKNKRKSSQGATEEETVTPSALETSEEKGKRKRKSSTNLLQENLQDLPSLHTLSSPKKKKKEKKKETSELSLTSPMKHKLKVEEFPTPPKSAKKVKHESSSQDSDVDPNDFTMGEMDSPSPEQKRRANRSSLDITSVWTVDDELALIDHMLKASQDEKGAYKQTLNKFDWNKVTIGNFSPQECQAMCEKLIHKVAKFKTLYTVLLEARDLAVNQPPKTKSKKDSRIGPEPPKDCFKLYYDSQLQAGKSAGFKGLEFLQHSKNLFAKMSLKKKAKYIVESCKEWTKYVDACKEFKESHPDWDQPISKPPRIPLLEEYFESLGVPQNTRTLQSFFMTDMEKKGKWDKSQGNKLMSFNSMFGGLPDKEKEWYKEESRNYAKGYEKRYADWKKSVPIEVALTADAIYKPTVTGRKRINKQELYDFNKISVSMEKPKFANQPAKPPASAFQIYRMKFEEYRKSKYGTTQEMKKACALSWKELNEDTKSRYDERYKEHRSSYKEKLLEFVRGMGNETKKVFLGFYRVDFYIYFKEDIFEREFPNVKYPVYEVEMKDIGKLDRVIDGNNLENVDMYSMQGKPAPESSGTEDEDSDSEDSGEDQQEEAKVKKEDEASSSEEDQKEDPKGGMKEESDSEDSDDESSDSEDNMTSFAAVQSHLKTPVRNSKKEEDSDSSDDEEDVLEAWQTPKPLAQKKNDDDDDDSSESEEDSSD